MHKERTEGQNTKSDSRGPEHLDSTTCLCVYTSVSTLFRNIELPSDDSGTIKEFHMAIVYWAKVSAITFKTTF
jgi:hypothetical protein